MWYGYSSIWLVKVVTHNSEPTVLIKVLIFIQMKISVSIDCYSNYVLNQIIQKICDLKMTFPNDLDELSNFRK